MDPQTNQTPPEQTPANTINSTPTPEETGSPLTPSDTGSSVPVVSSVKSGLPKKKLALIGIIVAAVLLLAGGAAAAYYGVVVPNQPQNVLRQSLVNSLDEQRTKSAAFEGEVKMSGKQAPAQFGGLTFQGGFGENGAITLSGSADVAVTKFTVELRSVDGKSVFIKLGGLTGLDKMLGAVAGGSSAAISQYTPLIAKINDQWFEINESVIKQAGGGLTSSNRLNGADAKRVGEAYKRNQFISIIKTLPDETIHGMKSHHYQIGIDKVKLKAFLSEVKNMNIANLTIQQQTINEVDKLDTSKASFELWVDRASKRIDQLKAVFTDNNTNATFRIALYDFNKPVKVEKPAGAKSILELLGGLLGGTSPVGSPQFLNQL